MTSKVLPYSNTLPKWVDRLKQPTPLTNQEIQALAKELLSPEELNEGRPPNKTASATIMFDKHHSLNEVAHRLFRGVFHSHIERIDEWESSNQACKVIDKDTKAPLFCCKDSYLKENFGVPQNGSVVREHLHYLLDHDQFAGVRPTFRVDFKGSEVSLQWFETNCSSLYHHDIVEEKKISLRKCVIHQFRTVNMDPNKANVLYPKGSHEAFPIDGGYCFPSKIRNPNYFEISKGSSLLEKPFLDEPFTEEELKYILSLNVEQDKALILKHHEKEKREKVLKIFVVTHLILKMAAERSQVSKVSITLFDLCTIRQLKEIFGPSSLFKYISKGKTTKSSVEEAAVIRRIDKVFNQIINIKMEILDNPHSDRKALATQIAEKQRSTLMKLLANRYLGL